MFSGEATKAKMKYTNFKDFAGQISEEQTIVIEIYFRRLASEVDAGGCAKLIGNAYLKMHYQGRIKGLGIFDYMKFHLGGGVQLYLATPRRDDIRDIAVSC